jgi:hypothetical protein
MQYVRPLLVPCVMTDVFRSPPASAAILLHRKTHCFSEVLSSLLQNQRDQCVIAHAFCKDGTNKYERADELFSWMCHICATVKLVCSACTKHGPRFGADATEIIRRPEDAATHGCRRWQTKGRPRKKRDQSPKQACHKRTTVAACAATSVRSTRAFSWPCKRTACCRRRSRR